MIGQDLLKELFHYDPESGVFIAKVTVNHRKKGDVAGCIGSHGYLRVSINNKLYSLHRLAFLYMTGEFPDYDTDHINRIRTDNRWKNLRTATHAENQRNLSIRSNNLSGVTGVSWRKDKNKWRARIMVDGKDKFLGYYVELKDAKAIRRAAEKQYGFIGE